MRLILVLAGAFVVFTGFDFAVGGIRSLGLEGPVLSLTATDPHALDARDSHARFLGGVWLTVGLVFFASAFRLQAMHTALLAAIAMIFVGGVARFTTYAPEVLLEPSITGSLVAELIGMPILFYWVWNSRRA
ncbi:MAG: DUF4345 domain-containing protein [Micropepsaceae bacterium]